MTTGIASLGQSTIRQLVNVQASRAAGQISLSVTSKTRGGRRIKKFIYNASDAELVARLYAEAARRRLLPALRSAVPKLTGRTSFSLNIKQQGLHVGLYGIFYAQWIQDKRNGDSVTDIVIRILEEQSNAIAKEVLRGLTP